VAVNNLAGPTNAFLWTLRPDGWLKLDYQYGLTGVQNFMGITFNYPSNQVTAMSWLGQGPYRVWKNRTAGQEVFTHTKFYNFPWTGQSTNYGVNYGKPTTQWTYPEFEGYHGQIYWAALQTTEQPITLVTPTPRPAGQLSGRRLPVRRDFAPARHPPDRQQTEHRRQPGTVRSDQRRHGPVCWRGQLLFRSAAGQRRRPRQ
jgi:hypothetical protein